MAKKNILNKRSRILVPALAAGIFAALGVLFLHFSSAAPLQSPQQIGYYGLSSVANNDGVSVFTSQDQVPGLGAQYVADITPGSKLTYVMSGKLAPTNICYYLRAYNSPKSAVQVTSADVTLVGTGSSRTVTLPTDDLYREVCVPSGKQTQLTYNIANLSNAAYILVYQALVKY